MKIRTGMAELKLNEEGEKYWEIHDSSSKDVALFDPGKSLEFNPDAFSAGTSVEIFEKEI